MRESIKQKLTDLLFKELKENIQFGDFTHADVEHCTDKFTYRLMTSFYAEEGERKHFDPDLPPEYENMCITCHWWSLTKTDVGGRETYLDKEAQEIVLFVLNEITKQ